MSGILLQIIRGGGTERDTDKIRRVMRKLLKVRFNMRMRFIHAD